MPETRYDPYYGDGDPADAHDWEMPADIDQDPGDFIVPAEQREIDRAYREQIEATQRARLREAERAAAAPPDDLGIPFPQTVARWRPTNEDDANRARMEAERQVRAFIERQTRPRTDALDYYLNRVPLPHIEPLPERDPIAWRTVHVYGTGDIGTVIRGGTLSENADATEKGEAPGLDLPRVHRAPCNYPLFIPCQSGKNYILGTPPAGDVGGGDFLRFGDSPGAYAYLQRGG